MTQQNPELEALALVAEAASWEDACPCLAERVVEKRCGMCWAQGGSHDQHCEPCDGTGNVARYPSLRKPCGHLIPLMAFRGHCDQSWRIGSPDGSWKEMGCPGWLPNDSKGAMWRLLTVDMREAIPPIAQVHVWEALQLAVALGEDARLALLRAVKAAMVARGG